MPKTYVLDTSVLLVRSEVLRPFRGARGGRPPRGARRAGGQAAPSRARVGGPPGLAGPGGAAHELRHAGQAPPGQRAGRHACGSRSTTRSWPACPPRCGPTPTTIASSPWPATWPTRAPTSPSSRRICRYDSRPASSGSPRTSTATSWWPTASWTGFAELDVAAAVIDELFAGARRPRRVDGGRDLPCHTGLALHAGSQSALARVHPDKRAHLVRTDSRGVRRARPLGRATDRHRPAQRPVHRDREPRRERRDRQERAGARRRTRGRAGGPHAPARHRLPPALLRRWAGPRLPARAPKRRRWARGPPR